MTHETLIRVLERANGGNGPEILRLFPLTNSVVWANLWLEAPQPDTAERRIEGDRVYLIRNEQQYVGIVLDMGPEDLHWLVLPEHRGNHYLSNALRSVILPHLSQLGRSDQRITISRNYSQRAFGAAEQVALAVGFRHLPQSEEQDSGVATLQYSLPLPVITSLNVQNPRPTSQRLHQLQRQLAYHASCLQMISEEVGMYLPGKRLAEDIEDVAIDVFGLTESVGDTFNNIVTSETE